MTVGQPVIVHNKVYPTAYTPHLAGISTAPERKSPLQRSSPIKIHMNKASET